MARFLALTSKGLAPILQSELVDLNFKVLKSHESSVLFESNWKNLYLANLALRSCTRILMPVLDFSCYNQEDLYFNTQKHDFTRYITPSQSIKVVAKLGKGGPFNHSIFVAQKVKDAIVDQFNNKLGQRPRVDLDEPDLIIHVRGKGSQFSIAIDTSGESLAHRGYRKEQGLAPLREHLAAGLILATGWNGQVPLVDPMCGSGTFLIEAASIARSMSPQHFKEEFAFESFKNFEPEIYEEVRRELESRANTKELKVFGFDRDPRAISACRSNLERAGLGRDIFVEQCRLEDLKNQWPEKGILVINPPYGERLEGSRNEALEEQYYKWGQLLKSRFQGWRVWMLSAHSELAAKLQMKASQKVPVYNGNIECRWLCYEIKEGL